MEKPNNPNFIESNLPKKNEFESYPNSLTSQPKNDLTSRSGTRINLKLKQLKFEKKDTEKGKTIEVDSKHKIGKICKQDDKNDESNQNQIKKSTSFAMIADTQNSALNSNKCEKEHKKKYSKKFNQSKMHESICEETEKATFKCRPTSSMSNYSNYRINNYRSSFEEGYDKKITEEQKFYTNKFGDKKDNLCFKQIKGDLFSVDKDVSLAHCVSQDLKMGRGIATIFKDKFSKVDELKEQSKQNKISL